MRRRLDLGKAPPLADRERLIRIVLDQFHPEDGDDSRVIGGRDGHAPFPASNDVYQHRPLGDLCLVRVSFRSVITAPHGFFT